MWKDGDRIAGNLIQDGLNREMSVDRRGDWVIDLGSFDRIAVSPLSSIFPATPAFQWSAGQE
jgi:hypothetical protein